MQQHYARRPLRLDGVFDPSPLYFITFNTHDRIRFLACDSVHCVFVRFAQRAADDFNIAVGRYVIMPDHIHLFVRGDAAFKLGSWIGVLKQALARAANLPSRNGRVWQEGSSIICCEATRVTHKSGIMFAKIRCEPDLLSQPKNGRTKARLFILIGPKFPVATALWAVPKCPNGSQSRGYN